MIAPATCIVFDMDDTLYLERDFVQSGFKAVGHWASKNAAIEGLAEAAWRRFENGDRGDIFDKALEDVGYLHGPVLVPALVSVYRAHRPTISLSADVADTLTELQRHAHLALITDGFSVCQRNKIEVLGLERWFDPIIVTDELGNGFRKPNSKAFECIEQRFRGSVARFAYVGDNPSKDFTAPSVLGWATFRIRREQGLHYKVESSHVAADFEIAQLGELNDWLFSSESPCRN